MIEKLPQTCLVQEMRSVFLLTLLMTGLLGTSTYAQQKTGPSLNPDISFDGLFSFAQFNSDQPLTFSGGHDPKNNGFNLQQVEVALGAAVDPYFRGDANIVLVQENGQTKTEIEEAYLTTLSMPFNLQVKAGQFFTQFGRHNPTHPHAWDWADKPLVLGKIFGGDGLRNPGAQISWLVPTPWYLELFYSAQNSTGDNAAPFLASATPSQLRSYSDLLHSFRLVNFFSLSDELSLNIGASHAMAPNDLVMRTKTWVTGGDVYIKYRPEDSLRFVAFQSEILTRRTDQISGRLSDWGYYSQLMYRFAERWIFGFRHDWTSSQTNPVGGTVDSGQRWRVSPVLTFYPSEFSKLRLQYNNDHADSLKGRAQSAVFLQFEFLMGAHGAHKF